MKPITMPAELLREYPDLIQLRGPANGHAAPRPDAKDMLKVAWGLVTKADWPFVPEVRFDKSRRWRFDWSSESLKLAVEIEGVVYGDGKGRHQTAKGLAGDCEKYNAAVQQGWTILRYTPSMIKADPFGVINQILAVAERLR